MRIGDIKKIAVLGGGTIGSSWATLFAMKGYSVVIFLYSEAEMGDVKKNIHSNLIILADNKVIPSNKIEPIFDLISYTADIKSALANVQFVQEAGPESYIIKQKFVSDFESYAPPSAIFATSTSGLLLSEIAKFAHDKSRILGGHPWNPPHLIPLIEMLKLDGCSDVNLNLIFNFYKGLGKDPIILNKEVYGHIGNRLQAAIYREVIDLVLSGVATVEDVDKALTFGPGLRWGIFGQGLIFHLGGGKGGTAEFMEKIGPSMDLWINDLADWKSVPKQWATIGHQGVEQEINSRPKVIGNNIDAVKAYRDRMLLNFLKLHKKL